MKKQLVTLMFLANFAIQALAYDFQAGNLLYSITSTEPPEVSLDGHIDGTLAQGELIIPETVDYNGIVYTVRTVRNEAFWGCSGLTGTLVLPETLYEICEFAFADCSGFTGTLNLPQSVTKIKYGAFHRCTGFTGVLHFPNSVIEIGNMELGMYQFLPEIYGAFEGCVFTQIELPESLTVIGIGCFGECSSLEGQLVMPNTVTEIQSFAFKGCTGLTGTLTLSNALETIGKEAFSGCDGFTGTLVIPESVTEMGWEAFAYCSGLDDVVFPDHPILQYGAAFYKCTGLTDIDIPDSWTSLRASTFMNCSNLVHVHLPDSMTRIEQSAFSECTSLSDINWPESLESIDEGAFYKCTSFTGELPLPNSVQWLWPNAFGWCEGFDNLVLGDSLKRIYATFENTNFKSVRIHTLVPPMLVYRYGNPEHAFWEKDILIIVPCGTLEAYRNAENWHDFTNMREEGVSYSFYAISEDEGKGTVNILKEASCDDWSVAVEAVPAEGGSFLYWECDGQQVSSENPYSFVLDQNMLLTARFSCPYGVEEDAKLEVSVYPNPAQTELHLQYSPDVKPTKVELYDLQGGLVRTQSKDLESLNLQGLVAGAYTMRVIFDNRKVFSDRVVKE